MVVSALVSALGQYFWKLAGPNSAALVHTRAGLAVLGAAQGHALLFVLLGFVLYGLGAVCMIAAFRFGSFSVLHPMQSLGYVFAYVIGYFLLGEAVTPKSVLGLCCILLGVFWIGAGDE